MWNKIPAVKILLPFLAGIVFALHLTLPALLVTILFWVLVFLYAALLYIPKFAKSFRLHILKGVVLQILLVLSGIYLVQVRNPVLKKEYFGNYLADAEICKIKILAPPEDRPKTIKLTVSVETVLTHDTEISTSGKSLVYIRKDSLSATQFSYGDILYVRNSFQKPNEIKNPHEFDYKKYLANQGIQYTAFLKQTEFVKADATEAKRFWEIIFAARLHFEHLIQQHVHDADAQSVSNALLLGIRSAISDEITQAYANTGTMHILSVSGLHVGILFFILDWLLKFIPYFKERKFTNKMVKAILITILIWFYACITGLSPSVSRSAVMFTFLIFGRIDTRYSNSYNILASSAIPLLFFNPFMLTQVGFQLSYLAILGIVTFQPVLSKLYAPHTIAGKYFWSLGSVSIAAQLGTVPVTILYFHQFPNYFLLSNMLAIPVSFAVLVSGIMFFMFSFIPALLPFTGWLLELSMKVLNYTVVAIDKIPGALTDGLFLTIPQTILFYFILIFAGIFIYSKRKFFLLSTLTAICILCFWISTHKFSAFSKHEVAVYALPQNLVLCETKGMNAKLYADTFLSDTSADFTYHIENNLVSKGIKNFEFVSMNDSAFMTEQVFMIDTNLFYHLNKQTPLPDGIFNTIDYVVITNNPSLQMEVVGKIFPHATILFAASNSYKNTQRWEEACAKESITCINMKSNSYTLLKK